MLLRLDCLLLKLQDWQVNREVLVIAVYFDVGGVKSPVYKAVPFSTSMLEIIPV